MTVEAVFFDLDGTLVDTAPDFIATANQFVAEHKLVPIDENVIRATVSDGSGALVKCIFGIDEDHPNFETHRQRLLDVYDEYRGRYSRLFPGIEKLLAKLQQRQLPWGIITNKPLRFSEPLIAKLNLSYKPTLLLCPDHVSAPKPDPESIHLACRHVGCDPDKMIYIGDHHRDILCGNRAGSTTIAAAYGYIKPEDRIDDWQADYVVDTADDIWQIIEQIAGSKKVPQPAARQRFNQEYTPAKTLLRDRVIAVTGAGSGIGKTVAKTYAEYGATVILIGRTSSKLENVYDEIEAAGLPQAAIYTIDFNNAIVEDYRNMAESLTQEFGRLDGIVHNAAILGQRTPLSNYSADTWQSVFQVNVTAPFMMTQALLPLLQNSDNASVIFTGSSVGYNGRAYWGAYAASKSAVENLMQTLADELDATSTIRSNSVNPGATRTSMRATAYPGENPDTIKSSEELMPLYLYLMSADSAIDNGRQFVI